MKIRLILTFLPCTLVLGCVPIGPATNHAGSQPNVRHNLVANKSRPPQMPVLKRTKKGNYRVMQPWTVELKGRRWLVPAGYSSNGITATGKLKAALGDGIDKPETWAAVFHDWLFTQPGVTRAQADTTFHELLLAYGVPPAKAQMMYNSVAAYSLFKAFR